VDVKQRSAKAALTDSNAWPFTRNKTHWYDGWFYDKVVAPNQDILFTQLRELVDPESKAV